MENFSRRKFFGEHFSRGHFSQDWTENVTHFSISIYQYLQIPFEQTKLHHFVIYCSDTQWTNLYHFDGQNLLFDTTLCDFYIDFRSKDLWKPRNEVGSTCLVELLVCFETINFKFWCNDLCPWASLSNRWSLKLSSQQILLLLHV